MKTFTIAGTTWVMTDHLLERMAERSMAFAKGRIECAKKVMALDI